GEDQLEAVESDEAGGPGGARARSCCEPIIGDPAVPFLERYSHLHPREVGAQASVRTAAEGQVAAFPAENDAGRIVVLGSVVIGGADRDGDVRVGRDQVARYLDITSRHSGDGDDRAVVAK